MTLAEYAKQITAMAKNHGNLEVYFSIDDEGNDFQPVNFLPSVIHVTEDGQMILKERGKQAKQVICIN